MVYLAEYSIYSVLRKKVYRSKIAKKFQSWWKFDKVLTKIILHSFFETRCILNMQILKTNASVSADVKLYIC